MKDGISSFSIGLFFGIFATTLVAVFYPKEIRSDTLITPSMEYSVKEGTGTLDTLYIYQKK